MTYRVRSRSQQMQSVQSLYSNRTSATATTMAPIDEQFKVKGVRRRHTIHQDVKQLLQMPLSQSLSMLFDRKMKMKSHEVAVQNHPVQVTSPVTHAALQKRMDVMRAPYLYKLSIAKFQAGKMKSRESSEDAHSLQHRHSFSARYKPYKHEPLYLNNASNVSMNRGIMQQATGQSLKHLVMIRCFVGAMRKQQPIPPVHQPLPQASYIVPSNGVLTQDQVMQDAPRSE